MIGGERLSACGRMKRTNRRFLGRQCGQASASRLPAHGACAAIP